ncbi:hypothetical protein LKK83_29295, partial [Phormidium sp. CCY1219]|nr:hypothetical protein [Phormidium sp. CCY1219]
MSDPSVPAMSYSLPKKNLLHTLSQPTVVAILASVGLHGVVGISWDRLPMTSNQANPWTTVDLVELTPEELSRLPNVSGTPGNLPGDPTQPNSSSTSLALGALPELPPTPPTPEPGEEEPFEPLTLPNTSSLYQMPLDIPPPPDLGEINPPLPSLEEYPSPTPYFGQPSASVELPEPEPQQREPQMQQEFQIEGSPGQEQAFIPQEVPPPPQELPPPPPPQPWPQGTTNSRSPQQSSLPPQGMNQRVDSSDFLLDVRPNTPNSPQQPFTGFNAGETLPRGLPPGFRPDAFEEPRTATSPPPQGSASDLNNPAQNSNLGDSDSAPTPSDSAPSQSASTTTENNADSGRMTDMFEHNRQLREEYRQQQEERQIAAAPLSPGTSPESNPPSSNDPEGQTQGMSPDDPLLARLRQLREEYRQQNRQQEFNATDDVQMAMTEGAIAYTTWVSNLKQQYPELETKSPRTVRNSYPPEACDRKLQGRGTFGVFVDSQGQIIDGPRRLLSTGEDILDTFARNWIIEQGAFPATSKPTVYQYSFEFSYNEQNCTNASSQPSDASPSPGTPLQPLDATPRDDSPLELPDVESQPTTEEPLDGTPPRDEQLELPDVESQPSD